MKYKLLKDLPVSAKGHIFDETGLLIDWPNFQIGLPWEINEEVALAIKLKWGMFYDWFEPIKETKSIYDLQEGDDYYFISSHWNIEVNTDLTRSDFAPWNCYYKDLLILNVFLTHKEAETELTKRKNIAELKRYIYDDGGIDKDALIKIEDLETHYSRVTDIVNSYKKQNII